MMRNCGIPVVDQVDRRLDITVVDRGIERHGNTLECRNPTAIEEPLRSFRARVT
jgi:hypothetical protein